MQRTGLLVATFIGSFGVVLLERGLYFFTEDVFAFDQPTNLWLGLVFGVSYVAGALGSHATAARFGEKRVLLGLCGLQVVVLGVLTATPRPAVTWAMFPAFGLISGMTWPIVESYVSAGLTTRQLLRVIGRFCIGWSAAVPAAVVVSGPMIESRWPASLFALAALCFVVVGAFFLRLPSRPAHTPEDHPDRPDAARLARYRALMVGSRWSLIASYAMLFLLAPLLPFILGVKLGLSTSGATAFASMMDWTRVAAFAALGYLTFWYGRATPLLAAVVLLPVSFLMVLFGPSLAWVAAGELVFGLLSGLVYYASLYYAVAYKNAAVEAGGGHEALIGGGFALGPMFGLVGLWLGGVTGGYVSGMVLGTAPLLLLCIVGGAAPLVRLLRRA